MKLLPHTLLWRTFLLVGLLELLSVLAWFAIYRHFERAPRALQTAQMVASVVNLTRAALVTAQPEKRRDLLLDLSDREGIRIYPMEAQENLAPLPDTPLFDLIRDEIRRQLGTGTRLTLQRDGEDGFWVSFAIEDDEYWVMLPRERLERVMPQQWIGWGAAALLLSLVGAYFIVFGVTRPLQALSRAAASIGRGDSPPALAEAGASEIATVSRAFNQMSRDLQQLDADRALILAGISHDLRTPLARLRLGIEMSGADEETRAGMNEDIDEMDKVIGQFLDFARETSGEALQAVDLAVMVREVAESYRRRGAPVQAEAPAAIELAVRPMALRRLLSNLVDNALRYAGQEQPIEIHARAADAGVVLEVQDRGPGIASDQVERLKRPFTRLDAARRDASGAGLGLAIVDRICRAHGARFDLLPRPGGGLVARVSMPREAASAGSPSGMLS